MKKTIDTRLGPSSFNAVELDEFELDLVFDPLKHSPKYSYDCLYTKSQIRTIFKNLDIKIFGYSVFNIKGRPTNMASDVLRMHGTREIKLQDVENIKIILDFLKPIKKIGTISRKKNVITLNSNCNLSFCFKLQGLKVFYHYGNCEPSKHDPYFELSDPKCGDKMTKEVVERFKDALKINIKHFRKAADIKESHLKEIEMEFPDE